MNPTQCAHKNASKIFENQMEKNYCIIVYRYVAFHSMIFFILSQFRQIFWIIQRAPIWLLRKEAMWHWSVQQRVRHHQPSHFDVKTVNRLNYPEALKVNQSNRKIISKVQRPNENVSKTIFKRQWTWKWRATARGGECEFVFNYSCKNFPITHLTSSKHERQRTNHRYFAVVTSTHKHMHGWYLNWMWWSRKLVLTSIVAYLPF